MKTINYYFKPIREMTYGLITFAFFIGATIFYYMSLPLIPIAIVTSLGLVEPDFIKFSDIPRPVWWIYIGFTVIFFLGKIWEIFILPKLLSNSDNS